MTTKSLPTTSSAALSSRILRASARATVGHCPRPIPRLFPRCEYSADPFPGGAGLYQDQATAILQLSIRGFLRPERCELVLHLSPPVSPRRGSALCRRCRDGAANSRSKSLPMIALAVPERRGICLPSVEQEGLCPRPCGTPPGYLNTKEGLETLPGRFRQSRRPGCRGRKDGGLAWVGGWKKAFLQRLPAPIRCSFRAASCRFPWICAAACA